MPMQFIYELGVNWCARLGAVQYAKRLIDKIRKNDPEAWIKLQWFNPETLCTPNATFLDGRNMREVLEANAPDWNEMMEVAAYARSCGLGVGCTVFNDEDALKVIGNDIFTFYKIGSPDFIDKGLLHRYMTASGRKENRADTIILSTGGCSREEIRDTLQYLTAYERRPAQTRIVLMHCVSLYPQGDPAWGALMNLSWLTGLFKHRLLDERVVLSLGLSSHIGRDGHLNNYEQFFGCPFGYVEVHVGEDERDVDWNVSLTPDEVQNLKVRWSNASGLAFGPSRPDWESVQHTRRFWVAVAEIKKGDQYTSKNIRAMRGCPDEGERISVATQMKGNTAKRNYKPGEYIVDHYKGKIYGRVQA